MLIFLDLHLFQDPIYYNKLYQILPSISLLTELFLLTAGLNLLSHFPFYLLPFFQKFKSLHPLMIIDLKKNLNPFHFFLIFLARPKHIFL